MTHHPAPQPGRLPVGRSLSSVAAGRRVRLLGLAGGRAIARRLADLGLTIGSTATIMQTSSTAVILAARGSRLALGRRLADEIMVTIEGDEDHR